MHEFQRVVNPTCRPLRVDFSGWTTRGLTLRGIAAALALVAIFPGTVRAEQLLVVDFESSEPGPYTRADLDVDWASQSGWTTSNASGMEHLAIVELGGSRVLESTNPADLASGSNGGTFKVNFPRTYDDLYMAFRVMFAEGFHFTKTGKMPRLQGGTYSACTPPTEGFSAAMSWHEYEYSDPTRGSIHPYVYHLDQPNDCGQGTSAGSGALISGRWYAVEVHVRLNTPGAADGQLSIRVDGDLVYERTSYRYRADEGLRIDRFSFKAAFGGKNTEEFRAIQDERTYYDDFIISTEPIGLAGPVREDAGVGGSADARVGADPSPRRDAAAGEDAGPHDDAAVTVDAMTPGDAFDGGGGDMGAAVVGGCAVNSGGEPTGPGPLWCLATLWLLRRRRK